MTHPRDLRSVRRYSQHYACFACRRAFKRAERWPPEEGEAPRESRPCPECGQPARAMGVNFKAPRRESANQWRKLELLARMNMLFHHWGRRPATLAEAKQVARRKGVL